MLGSVRGIFIFISLAFAQNAMACSFDWMHYGDDSVKSEITQQIGDHVSDAYCKYSKKYQLVLETNGTVMQGNQPMCVGWAVASLRLRGTKTQQLDRYFHTVTDTSCRTIGGANALATEAALHSVDDLMSNIDNYHVTK
jgi:hypothetical protein